jgi:GNAT superfamily N-acetyltransferase
MNDIDVTRLPVVNAEETDLEGVLKLQYLCYQNEAERYDFYDMPALTQTLDSLREDLRTTVFLVVRTGDEVIASVRGHHTAGGFHIGRLIVHPRVQRRGLGVRLLAAVEDRAGPVARFELFTGHRSAEFLGIYRKCGYEQVRAEEISPVLTVVHFEKRLPAGETP